MKIARNKSICIIYISKERKRDLEKAVLAKLFLFLMALTECK